jgi:hypothetical protein
MATTAQYTTQPIINYGQVSTQNTNRDGTGTIVTIVTGPSATAGAGVGERINRVIVEATGTTIAGMVRFFLSLDNGTTNRLIVEKPVAAITVGASTAGFRTEVPELVGLILPGGGQALLRASTHNAETFNIIVESGRL